MSGIKNNVYVPKLRNYFAFLIAMNICLEVSAAQSTIPQQFHGVWGDIEVGCSISPLDNDTGFKIAPRKYIAHEQVCDLVSLLKSDKHSLTAKFRCLSEGEAYEQVKAFSFSPTGNILLRHNGKFVRCDQYQ